jgi:hypothetical protein
MSDSSLLSFIEARAMRGLIGLDQAPASLEEAYAISASMMAALGQTVGGWKVGYAPDGTPIAAPMYAAGFLASGDDAGMRLGEHHRKRRHHIGRPAIKAGTGEFLRMLMIILADAKHILRRAGNGGV